MKETLELDVIDMYIMNKYDVCSNAREAASTVSVRLG